MKEVIRTESAPAAIGPYNQAVRAGNFLFISGQLGMDPDSGELAEDLSSQVERAIYNLKAVAEAAGGGLHSIVKTTVMLDSMDDFKEMNNVYMNYFKEDPPARAAYEVSKLPLGALVEIEAVAYFE
ncbi:MAG TPA: RidA family protein [Candidatus Krumholzibacteriaceae bacterium]|nr:RidA family protein [Candidatus Krumholzibacteriaceae bacterium]